MICRTPDCETPVFIKKRGLCKRHYMKAWQTGEFGQLATRHSVEATGEADTGSCSTCGPDVAILRQEDGRPICPGGTRAVRLWMHYALTPARVREMLDTSGWACEICSQPLDEQTARVDHDHACCAGRRSCGKCVRGILCHHCNVALGMVRDRPDILAAAAAYVLRKSASYGRGEIEENLPNRQVENL